MSEREPRPYRPKPRDEIARNMAAIRSKENKTERMLRSLLHRRGLRFVKYPRNLPGRPDFTFPRARVAVFIDGDYWHARVLQERGEAALVSTVREEHRPYWISKFQRTVERDKAATRELRKAGWLVVRVWESDARHNMMRTADRIERAIRRRLT